MLSDAVYLAMGIGALGAAVVPRLVFRRPLSMPMVFLAAGMLIAVLPVPAVEPERDRLWVEHATELCVIVSLMGAGLALNRPVGLRSWSSPWRLLGISMPLTIAATATAAALLLDWPLAPALLLAAALSPTDPVLAAEVRVGEPTDDKDDEDEVRFSLTAEAGLNDGLAFPFVLAALAVAAASGSGGTATDWLGQWFLVDVLARITVGVGVGLVTGWLLGRMFFRARPSALRLSEHMEGFVALGATFLTYGAAELLHGYGFLSVFVTACTIRAAEHSHGYHNVLHEFTEQIERLLTAFLLFLLGGYLIAYGLPALTWQGAVVALVLVLVVRPAAGWVGLIGSGTDVRERLVTAVFGIRGIGSLFYLAYALGHSDRFSSHAQQLWAVVAFTVLLSVLLHGAAATPVIRHLDRLRRSSPPPP
ncbi:cation:proton antiporter [Streptomyces sp. NPDC090127]|uniref:cation:proton antiporter domain-containing protein n=1 Tax=Streptomyces sp. NPDC090127 TaxID=3365953 RepID=UPI00381368DD